MRQQPESRADLEQLHSVLRRALERAERNHREDEAEQLARAVADLADELAGRG